MANLKQRFKEAFNTYSNTPTVVSTSTTTTSHSVPLIVNGKHFIEAVASRFKIKHKVSSSEVKFQFKDRGKAPFDERRAYRARSQLHGWYNRRALVHSNLSICSSIDNIPEHALVSMMTSGKLFANSEDEDHEFFVIPLVSEKGQDRHTGQSATLYKESRDSKSISSMVTLNDTSDIVHLFTYSPAWAKLQVTLSDDSTLCYTDHAEEEIIKRNIDKSVVNPSGTFLWRNQDVGLSDNNKGKVVLPIISGAGSCVFFKYIIGEIIAIVKGIVTSQEGYVINIDPVRVITVISRDYSMIGTQVTGRKVALLSTPNGVHLQTGKLGSDFNETSLFTALPLSIREFDFIIEGDKVTVNIKGNIPVCEFKDEDMARRSGSDPPDAIELTVLEVADVVDVFYADIASQLSLTPRTVDKLCKALFLGHFVEDDRGSLRKIVELKVSAVEIIDDDATATISDLGLGTARIWYKQVIYNNLYAREYMDKEVRFRRNNTLVTTSVAVSENTAIFSQLLPTVAVLTSKKKSSRLIITICRTSSDYNELLAFRYVRYGDKVYHTREINTKFESHDSAIIPLLLENSKDHATTLDAYNFSIVAWTDGKTHSISCDCVGGVCIYKIRAPKVSMVQGNIVKMEVVVSHNDDYHSLRACIPVSYMSTLDQKFFNHEFKIEGRYTSIGFVHLRQFAGHRYRGHEFYEPRLANIFETGFTKTRDTAVGALSFFEVLTPGGVFDCSRLLSIICAKLLKVGKNEVYFVRTALASFGVSVDVKNFNVHIIFSERMRASTLTSYKSKRKVEQHDLASGSLLSVNINESRDAALIPQTWLWDTVITFANSRSNYIESLK